MKSTGMLMAVLVACLLVTGLASCSRAEDHVSENHLSVTSVDGADRLSWRGNGQRLELRSGKDQRVHVAAADPAGLLGLRQGDVILTVNGEEVSGVHGLLRRMRAIHPAAAGMTLRRADETHHVTVAAGDYARLLPPRPPAPPAPPAAG